MPALLRKVLHPCVNSTVNTPVDSQWAGGRHVSYLLPPARSSLTENNAFPQVTMHLTPSRPAKNSSDKTSKCSDNLVYLCHAKGKSLSKTKTESCSKPSAPTESTFLSLQHKDSHQTEFILSVSMFKLDSHFSAFLRNYRNRASHNISHN